MTTNKILGKSPKTAPKKNVVRKARAKHYLIAPDSKESKISMIAIMKKIAMTVLVIWLVATISMILYLAATVQPESQKGIDESDAFLKESLP